MNKVIVLVEDNASDENPRGVSASASARARSNAMLQPPDSRVVFVSTLVEWRLANERRDAHPIASAFALQPGYKPIA